LALLSHQMVATSGGDGFISELSSDFRSEGLDSRIRAGALRCLARAGVRGTTLDDVADEAGCSRATIYRVFPGGRDVLLAAVLASEVERLLVELEAELDAAESLADALVAAIGTTALALRRHEVLQFLMIEEPGVVLPHLSFDGLDPLLERAVEFLGPHLERFTDPPRATELAEWAARLVVLYAGDLDAPIDLTEPTDTRRLVATYVLPGLPAHHRQELSHVVH
jgi:AcrR family transcriptional regulator